MLIVPNFQISKPLKRNEMRFRNRATKEGRLKERQMWIDSDIKKGFERIDFKGAIILINRTPDQNGKMYLKAYTGTKSNHDFYYSFRTLERLNTYLDDYKKRLTEREEYEAKKKKEGKSASNQAQTAKAIREELKKAYPLTKFKVTSQGFSGGDSVHISWTNGATVGQIESIVNKYQYGHFNGMEDIYEYSNMREDIPQSKYVQTSRTITDDLKTIMREFLEAQENENMPSNFVNNTLHRFFYKTEIPEGAKNVKIVRNETVTCGSIEDFYKLSFDPIETPKAKKQKPEFNKVETEKGEVKIIDYSEKSFALVGDTKPIKDELKEMGGKFNFRLSCGAGWIFPKGKLNELTEFLTNRNQDEPEQTQEPEQEEKKQVNEGLQEEIKKTLDFFVQTDKAIQGEVSQGTKEAILTQGYSFDEQSGQINLF